MVSHGQFYCHFHKIKIPIAEPHYHDYSRKKLLWVQIFGCYKKFPVLLKNGGML
jgi:hypothetical protein